MQPFVRLPRGKAEAAPVHANTPELARRGLDVRREDDAEVRADHVEGAVFKRKSLCVALDPVDLEPVMLSLRSRLLQERRRHVEPGHVRSETSRPQCDLTRPGGDVDDAIAGL